MTGSSTHAILTEARALLGSPDRWTKRAAARDAFEHPVRPEDPSATCFCLIGAIDRAVLNIYGDVWEHMREAHNAESALMWAVGKGIPVFNDDPATTYADVLTVLDNAVEATR